MDHNQRVSKYIEDALREERIIERRCVNQDVKRKANRAVQRAIVSGKLIRPTSCEECGSAGKIDAHHEDYSKPLEVNWLCKKCHHKRTYHHNALSKIDRGNE